MIIFWKRGDRMSGSKASVIEKINRMPDELNEFELIERLYMLSRLEDSSQRCHTLGSLSVEDVSEYFW